MEIKNRLFPYPVLCMDNDDYYNSEFTIETQMTEELNDIVLYFTIELKDNKELQQLIRDGDAEYIIHIECSTTAFRTIVRTFNNNVTYKIPKSKVNNGISLLGTIVAKKRIMSFYSEDLNEDYDGEKISFDKGSILAYENLPKIFVTKNYEELSNDVPYFTIIKKQRLQFDENNSIKFDINDGKIKILVDDDVYNEYVKYSSQPVMEPIIYSLLVMPAIIYMIETLREDGTDNFEALYWFQKIKKSYELQGKDFENDIICNYNLTIMDIVQDMLKLPINRAFSNLSQAIEE